MKDKLSQITDLDSHRNLIIVNILAFGTILFLAISEGSRRDQMGAGIPTPIATLTPTFTPRVLIENCLDGRFTLVPESAIPTPSSLRSREIIC